MQRLYNLLLLLSFLFAYMEWGNNNYAFVVVSEYNVVKGLANDPKGIFHPFIILPLLGQIMLLITLFQNHPDKRLTYTGMLFMGILVLMILIIGCLALNWKMIISALPFIIMCFFIFRLNGKSDSKS